MYLTEENFKTGIKNGIKRGTIYSRVYVYGWNVEKAINYPVKSRAERARKHPKDFTDLALKNGICLVTFYSRVRKGWNYEEAATIKPINGRRKI